MKMLKKRLSAQFKSIDELVMADKNIPIKIYGLANPGSEFPNHANAGILFFGPNGTGKTTIAKLIPDLFEKRSGNPNPAHYELRKCGVGPSGVEMLSKLDTLTDLAPFSSSCGFHYVILDEVDNLSSEAMKRLKSLMNKSNVVFILTTNNIKDIDKGVQNRSTLIHVDKPSAEQWLPWVKMYLEGHTTEQVMDLIRSTDLSGREIVKVIYRVWNEKEFIHY